MLLLKKPAKGLCGVALVLLLVMSAGIVSLNASFASKVLSPFASAKAYAAEEASDQSFVYMGSMALGQGDTQTILIGIGSEEAYWDSAVLRLMSPSGLPLEIASQETLDNAAVFSFVADEVGLYVLTEVEAFSGEDTAVVSLVDEENPCTFAVGATDYEVQALAEEATPAQADVTVYSVDEDGALTLGSELDEEAIAQADTSLFSVRAARVSAASYVVGIDPGHGGRDGGASAFGLKESDVTWGIANYCKEYLEANNVEVTLTREKDECPGLAERVDRAVAHKADVFVSIHVNSATNKAAHGAEVWYPNSSSYRYELHEQGAKLSRNILDKLVALGLADRGIKIKDATDEYYYPDDSLGDYYTVIAESREKGIVGIIVEHAFISNEQENAKLATPSFQRELGYADARGILQTYGLGDVGKPSVGADVKGTWQTENGQRYYVNESGARVTGLQVINQQRYYFDDKGYLQLGWIALGDVWYYADNQGVLQTGWQTIGGKRYYLSPDTARMVTGVQTIGGARFVFDASGACVTGKGWKRVGGAWYYLLADNAPAVGWRSIGGHWYYLDPSTARMATGWVRVDGTWYYMTASGAMCSPGWRSINGTWYYFNSSGAMAEGWKSVNGHWYYLWPGSGAMATGWASVNGTWYYLTASGAMCSPGWRSISGTWYYFNSSGAMAEGWKSVNGHWYYLWPGSGAMATGWASVNGTWYYLTASGAMCNPGWQFINGTWYYFESSGAMAEGWRTVGSSRYYLTPGSGAMVTGTVVIDGHTYVFNGSGAYVEDLGPVPGGSPNNPATPNPEPSPSNPDGPNTPAGIKHPISGTSQATAAAMADYYRATYQTYPTHKYTDKGAPTLEDFCQIVLEEANAEGIRAEVVFCQAMKETGWLQFGGTVDKDGKVQCNFAGLGATSHTPGGATFADVREGVRAQVQHLKAYASEEPLKNACVDPRFQYVTRGSAPNLEDLNGRWAVPGDGYGESIAMMIETLLSYL